MLAHAPYTTYIVAYVTHVIQTIAVCKESGHFAQLVPQGLGLIFAHRCKSLYISLSLI